MENSSKLVLLGTGTPNAEPDRSGPAVAIVVRDSSYIVDCGPGVVRQAQKAAENGIGQLSASKLKTAFITHLHSDHTTGLADLLLTPWVLGRIDPLTVLGPAGIRSMTGNIVTAYAADIQERINGPQPGNTTGYHVIAKEIREGLIFEDENVRVGAFRTNHGSFSSFGFRFETPDKVITISGDTAPSDDLLEKYRGSDILVHEVYSTAGFKHYPPDWQRYHSTMHTSSEELAEVASIVQPGLLVVYHHLYNGVSDEELLEEIMRDYDGPVVSGKDLDIF